MVLNWIIELQARFCLTLEKDGFAVQVFKITGVVLATEAGF
jgi:hypothetical protein